MKKLNYIVIILAILAFIESIYIYIEPAPRKGLEYLLFVPLMFAFCILFFGNKIISYHSNGVGLKIYYSIILFRYLIQPFLIVITRGKLNSRMPEADESSYPVAIFIYFIELFVACWVIQKWYPKYHKEFTNKKQPVKQVSLGSGGMAVLICYFLFLFARSVYWIPAINILGIKESNPDLVVVFEATIFNCVKVFVFIGLLITAQKNIRIKKKFRFYFFLAVIAGIFNFISYFGTNRSFIYETAIATIGILIYCYPQFRKKILIILIPFAIVIMVISYVTKQFAVEDTMVIATEKNDVLASNIIEEYTNGLWTVARSYQASIGLDSETSMEALIKDLSDGISGLSDLPGIKSISEELKGLKSSSDIFKDTLRQEDDRGQMLSLSGGFLIIGGEILGWLLLVLGNYLMIKFLVKMEVASKIVKDMYYKYMYIWMSCLMGLVHCYCLQTIIFCWSKFILFYWLVLFINKMLLNKKLKYNPNFTNFKNTMYNENS